MQTESISVQHLFKMQAFEKNGDDSKALYCSIDCYI